MNFVVSAIFSKRPGQERIRPGTPWYRAESPAPPRSPVTVHHPNNGNVDRLPPRNAVKERKACCRT